VGVVTRQSDHEGLSLGYRVMYRIKHAGLSIFGPAQLGESEDPRVRLERERAAKVAAAHQPPKS
jgi:hypothetical protein